MRGIRTTVRGVAAALLAVAAAACSAGSPPTSEVGVTEVVVGTFGPQTGPAAAWGTVMRGMDAYFRLVNEDGGVHGRRLRLVIKDDQYQPARTVSSVRELVERDRVFAIVGGIGTAPVSAVRGYLSERGVPVVGILSGAHQFTIPEDPLIFGALALYAEEASVLVDAAVERLGRSRIAVAYQNDDFGRGGLLGTELALRPHGLEPIGTASVELMDSDVSAQALRLRQSGADAVLLYMAPRHAAMLVQEAARIGFRPQWLASTTLSDAELMDQLTGGLWRGTVFGMMVDIWTESEELARFREAHRRFAADERPGVFFYGGMNVAASFVEGLRRTGEAPTREAFIAALEGMDGWSVIGAPVDFGGNRRHMARSIKLGRLGEDGQVAVMSDWVRANLDMDEYVRLSAGQ